MVTNKIHGLLWWNCVRRKLFFLFFLNLSFRFWIIQEHFVPHKKSFISFTTFYESHPKNRFKSIKIAYKNISCCATVCDVVIVAGPKLSTLEQPCNRSNPTKNAQQRTFDRSKQHCRLLLALLSSTSQRHGLPCSTLVMFTYWFDLLWGFGFVFLLSSRMCHRLAQLWYRISTSWRQ